MTDFLCPCQSKLSYQDCCGQYHQHLSTAKNGEQLMRSRYVAYTLKNLSYIVETTLPSQQILLDKVAIQQWMNDTEWLGLEIVATKVRSKIHENVEFKACFRQNGEKRTHDERSLFVKIQDRWYFVDHSLLLPTMKSPCICGSGKKFKHCCGLYLTE